MRKAIRFAARGALVGALALAAAPALAAELGACQAVQDPAKRLACYDAAAKMAPAPPPQAMAGQTGAASPWTITPSRSPIDGSLQIIATKSDGGDSFSGNDLVIACKARQTQMSIVSRTIRNDAARRGELPVRMEIAGRAPIDLSWRVAASDSNFRTTLVYPDPKSLAPLLMSLPPSGAANFQIKPLKGAPHAISFALDGLDEARGRIAAACNWAAMPAPSPAAKK